MPYYTPEEMKVLLADNPEYADRLYCRGFLLTTKQIGNLSDYPFYSNWKEQIIACGSVTYFLYTHFETYSYQYRTDDKVFFLIGHAYDPFHMITDENILLKDMAAALSESEGAYWDRESDLTGVFCTGFISDGQITYSTDCCGMQIVYHGVVDGELYVTSHSKLVADLINLKQTEYIEKLINNHFWHYFGVWLPGDCSPYSELKRLVPNFNASYKTDKKEEIVKRYYPTKAIVEAENEEECNLIIKNLGQIMSNTMLCISQKWHDQKISISVTGGRDSMTTLACANGLYDKFSYFSYQSNYDESVDVVAAGQILSKLGMKHEIYIIPTIFDSTELATFRRILECNAGCIGKNNENDVRKRLYFNKMPPCDVEVKSWVSEMGRAYQYAKYNKKSFPKYPYPSFWRVMHKPYFSPYLIKKTDKVFDDYLKTYYCSEVFDKVSWLELFFWEFDWNANEGQTLTAEHRVSYEITIPFNNRKYIEAMLCIPLEKRKKDWIPKAIIQSMNKAIDDTGIVVKDVSHNRRRSFLLRSYIEIMSKIK